MGGDESVDHRASAYSALVDLRQKFGYRHGDLVGIYPFIAEEDEILRIFFSNHNLIINWLDCNYTWGWLDDETGKWTGAVGKVTIYSM